MGKKRKNGNKGVTLTSLVVIIIVLLILAGISISMLAGQNGILNRAFEAKEKTEIAQIIERVRLDILEKEAFSSKGEITREELRTILNNYFTDVPETLPEDENELENLELISKDGGYPIKVGDIWSGTLGGSSGATPGGTTDTLPSETGTTPYLPSSDFKQLAGTNLGTGLVIEDEIGNQYVWIEVPRTAAVYPTAGTAITNFTEAEYTKIENDLHTYTNTYRNGTSYTDTYYADATTGWFANEEEYNTAKQRMLKSVYQNGGFWIGRYEAGIETNRTEKGEATIVPQSKENLSPYNYVTRTQAKVLAEQVNSGNYTSSLMFGVQWDLVLKYLETKGATVGELNTDSTSWGNYYNATFTLNRGKFAKYGALSTWYDYTAESLPECVTGGIKQSATSASNAILLTTGASDTTKKQNIYDLAGNVWEWTLEYTSDTFSSCSIRGGGYYGKGLDDFASDYSSFGITNAYSTVRISHYTLLKHKIS